MKLKLKLLKEQNGRKIYIIDQEIFIIDGISFKIKKNTSNLSKYLNKKGSSILILLNNSINNKCYNCDTKISKNRFERNKFITYNFCEKCNNRKIKNKYKNKKCCVCGKELLSKNIKYSTCGEIECLKIKRNDVSKRIKNTHWSKTENKKEIIKKRIINRKANDLKYDRKYIAWNKGKTGIYSKETIEKIRNATINQMKNGKIKKTKQEKIFEQLLIENNIKYKYSFIYKNRQFDFLLIDYNLVIELQGDYWHGNPKFWDINNNDNTKKKLYETQIMKKKDDIIKEELINNSIYNFIFFWEYDVHNNLEKIKQTLFEKYNIIFKK